MYVRVCRPGTRGSRRTETVSLASPSNLGTPPDFGSEAKLRNRVKDAREIGRCRSGPGEAAA